MRTGIFLLLTATTAEDWVQRTNNDIEAAWPASLDRGLQAAGSCDKSGALESFRECLLDQCPTIVNARATKNYVFPRADTTATTCQEARELAQFRDACCASQLIEYACDHHRSYEGGYEQLKVREFQKRNDRKWVEGKDDVSCRDAWRGVVECVWQNGVETAIGTRCDMTCPEPATPAPTLAPSLQPFYPTKMPTQPAEKLQSCPCAGSTGWARKKLGSGWVGWNNSKGVRVGGGADPRDPDNWRCRNGGGVAGGGSGKRGGPRAPSEKKPRSEGQKGQKNAIGRYNGYRGECGPRLPDERVNAELFPPCAVDAARRAAPLFVALVALVAG